MLCFGSAGSPLLPLGCLVVIEGTASEVASEQAECKHFPLQLAFFPSQSSGYLMDGDPGVNPELLTWAGWQAAAGCWVQAALTRFSAKVSSLHLSVLQSLLEFIVCTYFTLLYSSMVAPVQSFACMLLYCCKSAFFVFQYKSGKSGASTRPVPLSGCPFAPG